MASEKKNTKEKEKNLAYKWNKETISFLQQK